MLVKQAGVVHKIRNLNLSAKSNNPQDRKITSEIFSITQLLLLDSMRKTDSKWSLLAVSCSSDFSTISHLKRYDDFLKTVGGSHSLICMDKKMYAS